MKGRKNPKKEAKEALIREKIDEALTTGLLEFKEAARQENMRESALRECYFLVLELEKNAAKTKEQAFADIRSWIIHKMRRDPGKETRA